MFDWVRRRKDKLKMKRSLRWIEYKLRRDVGYLAKVTLIWNPRVKPKLLEWIS